tara:strand:- start:580 stop:816 length:237 start_codon:yes stop_codon:yes gene_type:complete
MDLIKPLNKKVSMFATNDELYNQLTNKEIMTIKLAKLEEFADDLYRSTTSECNANLFLPETSWFNIRKLLKELNQLND